MSSVQNQNQNSLLVKRQNDNTSQGDWPRKISPRGNTWRDGEILTLIRVWADEGIQEYHDNRVILLSQSSQVSRYSHVTHANQCFHTLTRRLIKISRRSIKGIPNGLGIQKFTI